MFCFDLNVGSVGIAMFTRNLIIIIRISLVVRVLLYSCCLYIYIYISATVSFQRELFITMSYFFHKCHVSSKREGDFYYFRPV